MGVRGKGVQNNNWEDAMIEFEERPSAESNKCRRDKGESILTDVSVVCVCCI